MRRYDQRRDAAKALQSWLETPHIRRQSVLPRRLNKTARPSKAVWRAEVNRRRGKIEKATLPSARHAPP